MNPPTYNGSLLVMRQYRRCPSQGRNYREDMMLLVMLHDLADYDHPFGRQVRFDHDDIDAAAESIADAYGEPVDEIKAQLNSNRHELNLGGIVTTAVTI